MEKKCPLSLVTPNYYFLSDGYCPVVFKAIMYFCLINTGLRSSSICHKIIKQSLHRQGGIFWQDSWQQSDRELALLKLSLDRIFSLKHSYSSIWYSVALGTVHLKEFIQYWWSSSKIRRKKKSYFLKLLFLTSCYLNFVWKVTRVKL